MKTFYPGCKIDTNIPIKELYFIIKIYDSARKKYIFDMRHQNITANKEAHIVFNSPTDIPIEAARKHKVTLYLYRRWNSSEPKLLAYRDIGLLSAFDKPDNFRKLTPLKAKQSQDNSSPVIPGQPASTCTLKIQRKYIFVTPEHPSEHPKDPFRKAQIEQELKDRMVAGQKKQGTGYPSQESTSLCGPAAYFYCLLKNRPDLYCAAVKGLWEDGKAQIGSLKIEAGDAAKPRNFFDKKGTPRMIGIDWVTMASLRESENFYWDYDEIITGKGVVLEKIEGAMGVTPPWELYEWLKKSGAKNIKNLITVSGSSNLAELVKINEYAKKGYKVVQLMSSPNIFRGETTPNFKAHWIVWESPLRNVLNGISIDLNSKLMDTVDLDLFTWGWVGKLSSYNPKYTANISLKKFLEASFGAIVFKGWDGVSEHSFK